jgi:hypothetical protein
MEGWTPLGKHRYRFSGGVLWIDVEGEFSEEQLATYATAYQDLLRTQTRLGILADVGRGITASPAVRKKASLLLRPIVPPVPVAVIGASVTIRTLFNLFINAQRLLYGTESTTAFFSTAPQALAWLEAKIADRERRLVTT